jgi:hypothetical protein
LHHRFVIGGYVRKRVTLRISKGLRAVALAAGISRRVYSDTRVIFTTIIAIYIALAEKIGTPLIIFLHYIFSDLFDSNNTEIKK